VRALLFFAQRGAHRCPLVHLVQRGGLPDPDAMDQLSEEQRELMARYWWGRAQGEMGASIAFRYLVDDLEALGSPSPVIELARRAVSDERNHSLWGRDWALRFGHPDLGAPEPRSTEALAFKNASERDNRLLRVAFYCLTESCGCTFLQDLRPRITHPELRALNRRHLADEVQHARLCWAHLSTLGPRDRAMLTEWMPTLLQLLPTIFCDGDEGDHEELVPFGYFTPRLLREAHQRALAEVIRPGFAHLGMEVAA
jgi:hypothetical protein